MPHLSVDTTTCTRCGLCRTICPLRIIRMPDGSPPSFVDEGALRCITCGHCQAVCPTGAITVEDPRLDPDIVDHEECSPEQEQIIHWLRMRRSIRHFRDEPVNRATITRLLDVARHAPSGSNLQPVQWLVIHDTAEVRRLTGIMIDWMRGVRDSDSPVTRHFDFDRMIRSWEKGNDPLCRNAPHLIIAHSREKALTARVDAIIALTCLDIAAPAFGLGACWAGFFHFAVTQWPPLREALALPAGHQFEYALMLGYPAIRYQRPPRRNRMSVTWR